MILKVTKKNGVPLFNGKTERSCPCIEEAGDNFGKEGNNDCLIGIYCCEEEQLEQWYTKDCEVREVEIVGEKIILEKGYCCKKVKHLRILTTNEIEEIAQKHGLRLNCLIQTAGNRAIQTAGFWAKQTAGNRAIQTAGAWAKQTADNDSQQTAGNGATQIAGDRAIQTAGAWAEQTAGNESQQTAGNDSQQTAGYGSVHIIFGDTSYIIKKGRNCVLIQYYQGGKYICDLDELLKDYEIGEKIKIVKGKVDSVETAEAEKGK